MICEHCKKEFSPAERAELSAPNGDNMQVVTECPHCDSLYYAFTEIWVFDQAGEKEAQ